MATTLEPTPVDAALPGPNGSQPSDAAVPQGAARQARPPKVIKFNRVSKRFTLHHERARSFQEAVVSLFGLRSPSKRGVPLPGPARQDFWALRDVSFGVLAGEVVGIIGENGSGKSTTLKLITRILQPTSGSVSVRGKVSALLELGAGFHPDLTGRENIYLNGSLLGLHRKEIDERYGQIVEFAELQQFIDTPVKHYSSGMSMRLGFAVAVHVNPEILLTDEVLAVGDEAFQRKCLDYISSLRKRGVTIIYVSHALDSVRSLCNRAIWLDHGKLIADGPAGEVIDHYLAYENEKHAERVRAERSGTAAAEVARPEALARVEEEEEETGGETYLAEAETQEASDPAEEVRSVGGIPLTGKVKITGVDFLNEDEEPSEVFQTGEILTIRVRYEAIAREEDPTFGIALFTESGVQINGPNTRFAGFSIDAIEGEGEVLYTIPALPLLPGRYHVTAAVTGSDMTDIHDHQHRIASFVVQPTPGLPERWGLTLISAEWAHRADGGARE